MTPTPHLVPGHRADTASAGVLQVHSAVPSSLNSHNSHPTPEFEVPAYVWDCMLPGVEDLAIRVLRKGARRIGIVGAHARAGVSTLSQMLAQVFVSSGFNALHIDLAGSMQIGNDGQSWESSKVDPSSAIFRRHGRPAVLVARPTSATRSHFHDSAAVGERFADLLGAFEPLVVELAPLVERSRSAISPVAAAAACDWVVFLCSRARTRRDQVEAAVELCRSNDISLAGLVMNDIDQSSRMGRASRSSHHRREL